ncbi:DNA polymerase ligase N-terminal domain-containing protein [Salininema proteolyticum]|uniref:DNA polymerase ligase N-terminal domain-containing protein n=1 Tax=Salininema proteolyticum TaxID=1607685 RepID=A0ABV8U4C0_9ACTN
MRTENHTLEHAGFEGTIPKGPHGAGTVVVWDTGTYRNLTEDDGAEFPVEETLDDGHLVVWLDGERLTGAFALTKVRRHRKWLLIKRADLPSWWRNEKRDSGTPETTEALAERGGERFVVDGEPSTASGSARVALRWVVGMRTDERTSPARSAIPPMAVVTWDRSVDEAGRGRVPR